MDPIDLAIKRVTDNDSYKFSMGQAAMHHYDDVFAGYTYINRGGTKFPKGFDKKLRQCVDAMADLQLEADEALFMRDKCYYQKASYIDWLRGFRYDPSQVSIRQDGGDLQLSIYGPWYTSIYWEVPLMALISELYYHEMGISPAEDFLDRVVAKVNSLILAGVKFAEFGGRRRFAAWVQREVVRTIANTSATAEGNGRFVGTSNLMLAHEFGLTPIGTNAHEWVMAHAAIYGNRMANQMSMEVWAKEFDGQLGTALADTFTTPVFLRSFGNVLGRLFDGVRQDSGDPFEFIELMVAHYQSLRINPLHKTIIFSDGLDVQRTIEIAKACEGRIGCSFGIGTNLSNDVGAKPLNHVIKASFFETKKTGRVYVCKLSDDPGKRTGKPEVVANTLYELGLPA